MSITGMPALNHPQFNLHCSQLTTSYRTVFCLMLLNGATCYTPSATQTGKLQKPSEQHKLHPALYVYQPHVRALLSCKSEQEAGMFGPHT
jgi:hypothetical protein